MIRLGIPQGGMPGTRHLSKEDVALLVTFVRSLGRVEAEPRSLAALALHAVTSRAVLEKEAATGRAGCFLATGRPRSRIRIVSPSRTSSIRALRRFFVSVKVALFI